MTHDTPAPVWVFYDGACGLCSGAVAWALRRDRRGALRPVAVPSEDARARLGTAGMADALEALHVSSDAFGVRTGAEAIAAMLRVLPGWRVAGVLLGTPPVLAVARPVYGWIARHRSAFGRARCPLPKRLDAAPGRRRDLSPRRSPLRPPLPPRSHRS